MEQKTFKTWRIVTDTIAHYKIYLAIHGYTLSKNKDIAKSELKKCDLSDINSFNPEIKNIIKEIMSEEKDAGNVGKKTVLRKGEHKDKIKTNNVDE